MRCYHLLDRNGVLFGVRSVSEHTCMELLVRQIEVVVRLACQFA